MNTHCIILLGGIWGGDGWVTSRGMLGLKDQLSALPYTTTAAYSWSNWQKAQADLAAVEQPFSASRANMNMMSALPSLLRTVLIGYSGGGMMGMVIANRLLPQQWLDLLVLYDPSPPKQIEPLGNNGVRNALCYHNTKPRMWWPGIGQLGGGELKTTPGYTGKHKQIDFAQFHLWVQNNKDLHARTVAAVKALQDGQPIF